MKQNSKINLKLTITITILIIVALSIISSVQCAMSKYVSEIDGDIDFSVAKPICELVIDNEPCVSNYKSEPLYFSVNNFDKNGDVSDVAMEYFITFNVPQNATYLSYSLYLIEDGEDKELELTNSNRTVKTVDSSVLNAGENKSNKYKLEIEYNDDLPVNLEDEVSVSITLDSKQVNPA